MKLTKHTEYSLRVLMYLAIKPEERGTIPQLSELLMVSRSHLMKVISHLAQFGYIDAQRGRGGGVRLGAPANDIKIGAVIRDMERSLEIVDCNAGKGCPFIQACKLKSALIKASDAFIETLMDYSLSDVVKNDIELIKLVG